MTSPISNMTRRKFILLSSVALAAPLLTDLTYLIPESEAAINTKPDQKSNEDDINPKCDGCQVCTIFFSVCLTVNNRVCWCDVKGNDRSGA